MHSFRRSFATLFLLSAAAVVSAAVNVQDLGVPAGWSAAQYDDMGNELLNKGDYKGARRYLDAAIRVMPDRWTAYYNRALTYWKEKNWPAALQDLNTTIKLKPAFFQASWTRVGVYLHLNNYSAALKDLDLLAKLTVQVQQPRQFAEVINQRAWLRATCPDASFRNGNLATTDAKKACDLTHWKNSTYLDTLAAASAEAGDFDSAVRSEEQAVNLISSGKDEHWRIPGQAMAKEAEIEVNRRDKESLSGYSKRLDLYKQHKPYRDR